MIMGGGSLGKGGGMGSGRRPKGGGPDQVTVMIYMGGTGLESRNGMATSDLQEMMAARLSGGLWKV